MRHDAANLNLLKVLSKHFWRNLSQTSHFLPRTHITRESTKGNDTLQSFQKKHHATPCAKVLGIESENLQKIQSFWNAIQNKPPYLYPIISVQDPSAPSGTPPLSGGGVHFTTPSLDNYRFTVLPALLGF